MIAKEAMEEEMRDDDDVREPSLQFVMKHRMLSMKKKRKKLQQLERRRVN